MNSRAPASWWRSLPKFAAAVLGVSTLVALGVVLYYLKQPNPSVKDLLDNISSIATVTALIVAGHWTYSLFIRQRQLYPRAAISHSVFHRAIDQDWILLHITVDISNSGTLLLPLRYILTRVQQVLPLPADQMEQVQRGQSLVRPQETEVEWDMLDEREANWDEGVREIEPGNSQAIHYDFIIDSEAEVIKIFTYLRNEMKKQEGRDIGFTCTTLYDLRNAHRKASRSIRR